MLDGTRNSVNINIAACAHVKFTLTTHHTECPRALAVYAVFLVDITAYASMYSSSKGQQGGLKFWPACIVCLHYDLGQQLHGTLSCGRLKFVL